MKHEHDEQHCQECLNIFELGTVAGKEAMKENIKEFIDKQRSKGNLGKSTFSAAICLSDLLKEIDNW